MKRRVLKPFRIKVADLKELCEGQTTELAKTKLASVGEQYGITDEMSVIIDQAEVQALIDRKEVKLEEVKLPDGRKLLGTCVVEDSRSPVEDAPRSPVRSPVETPKESKK
jgi:hypothetical protein